VTGTLIRVLLVDDQELIRTGLRGILRAAFGFDVVGECADGSGVIAAVDALAPDVVLMDVRMPVVGGVRATTELRGRSGSPPVLALTTFDDDEALAGMLRAGASGFVLKGVPAEDLQHAVRAVAAGGAWLDPAVTARVLAIYRSAAPRATPDPQATRAGRDADLGTLTGRELDVLARIGRGRTNGEIAAELFVSEGTVKTHINHLFTKLGLRDRAAAVVFAYDHGLVRPELELHASRREPGRAGETVDRSVKRNFYHLRRRARGGTVQGPAERGEDAHGQQPPGVDAGRVDEQGRHREGHDHDDRDAPVVTDHEVVPERADRLEPLHEATFSEGRTGSLSRRRCSRAV
jgi:DNA-binding NarL/FixJ family response regulator